MSHVLWIILSLSHPYLGHSGRNYGQIRWIDPFQFASIQLKLACSQGYLFANLQCKQIGRKCLLCFSMIFLPVNRINL